MLPGMCPGGASGAGSVGGGAEVSFVNRSPYGSAITPSDATATWETTSAGADNSTGEAGRTWLLIAPSSAYELFVTLNSGPGSGASVSGVFGTWRAMNATLTYSVTRTSNIDGINAADLSCLVRRVSDLVVIAGFDVALNVEVLP